MTQHYGALPEDWFTLELAHGLGEDLLPVVSNPNAKISEKSNMKGLGKTPSWYNSKREVVGISKWTDRMAETADIERWAAEPDYGICIQTRTVRALDIDVTDQEEADAIWAHINGYLKGLAPTRSRNNSPKRLVAFRVVGDMPKRVFKTHNGIVEFLATGQQFIAYGTHPSGARYEWDALNDFPELTVPEFEQLWHGLVECFAIEAPKQIGGKERPHGTDLAIYDPMTDRLAAAGLILDWGNDGQAFIECPWKAGHSSDSGITETAYFPAGTRGHPTGHFKCLHAGCSSRTDFEFEAALLDVADNDFDDLPAIVVDPKALKTVPEKKLSRDKKGIDATLQNLTAILDAPGSGGVHIIYDRFLDEDMWMPVDGSHGWVRIDDKTLGMFRLKFETMGFKPIGQDLMRTAVEQVAMRNQVDSAQQWLTTKEWDGVPRVETFLTKYMGAEDHPYVRAVARYMWSALAARVLVPGCQADMMPIFVGKQGVGKSRAIRAMAPCADLFCELSFHMKDDDMVRQMKGTTVCEVSELQGMGTRELNSIKAFVTRPVESWVPKFKEKRALYLRRTILFGTTNETNILWDDENRRFLPVTVGTVSVCNVEAIKRDCDQLWAEGAHLARLHGLGGEPSAEWEEAQRLAPAAHKRYHMADESWEESIDHWIADALDKPDASEPVWRTRDILQDALGLMPSQVRRTEEARLRKIMQVRGYLYGTHRVNGVAIKGWKKKEGSVLKQM